MLKYYQVGWSDREAGSDRVVPMGHSGSELTLEPATPTPGLTSSLHRRDCTRGGATALGSAAGEQPHEPSREASGEEDAQW